MHDPILKSDSFSNGCQLWTQHTQASSAKVNNTVEFCTIKTARHFWLWQIKRRSRQLTTLSRSASVDKTETGLAAVCCKMCYRCTVASQCWDSATIGFLDIKQINNYKMKHRAMFGGTPLPVCAARRDIQSSHVGLGLPNTELNATYIITLA